MITSVGFSHQGLLSPAPVLSFFLFVPLLISLYGNESTKPFHTKQKNILKKVKKIFGSMKKAFYVCPAIGG